MAVTELNQFEALGFKEIAQEVDDIAYALDNNSAIKVTNGEVEVISEGN